MRNVQIETRDPAEIDYPLTVSFTPSIDDYVNISRGSTGTGERPHARYFYQAFLLLNGICFPAYLLLSSHPIAGLIIFTLNLAIVVYLIPVSEKRYLKRFYTHFFRRFPNEYCSVRISADGLEYGDNGNIWLVAWKNITTIQEYPDSVCFFGRASGIPVRREAFESPEHCHWFVERAREYIRSAKLN